MVYFKARPKNDFTRELIEALDKELRSINFPGVTFVPMVDKEKRERELINMMERRHGD